MSKSIKKEQFNDYTDNYNTSRKHIAKCVNVRRKARKAKRESFVNYSSSLGE
jgi:hypothetical protein